MTKEPSRARKLIALCAPFFQGIIKHFWRKLFAFNSSLTRCCTSKLFLLGFQPWCARAADIAELCFCPTNRPACFLPCSETSHALLLKRLYGGLPFRRGTQWRNHAADCTSDWCCCYAERPTEQSSFLRVLPTRIGTHRR